MSWKQNATRLEAVSARAIQLKQQLQGHLSFAAGAHLVISSCYADFQDENGKPVIFFVGKLTQSVSSHEIQQALLAESYRSPQIIRHRIRALVISKGCVPVISVPENVLTQVLHLDFHFEDRDLEPYRLIPFGEKITKWMNGQDFENAEFTPVTSGVPAHAP